MKMPTYGITQSQKDFLRWAVGQIRNGNLGESFVVIWLGPESGSTDGLARGDIVQCKGGSPTVTKGLLDALAAADLLSCTPSYQTNVVTGVFDSRQQHIETSRECTLTGKAYEAVDSDFAVPPPVAPTQVTIGAVIHSMSGGNVQAIGIAEDADISQVVNDANLLRANVKGLAEELMARVKAELNVDDLAEYAQALKGLKDQLLAEKPDPSFIQRSVRTLGLLGDVEGTIALMTRVWPLLYPLLLIAGERLAQGL